MARDGRDPMVVLRDAALAAAELARGVGGGDEERAAGMVHVRLRGVAMMAANRSGATEAVMADALGAARRQLSAMVDDVTDEGFGSAGVPIRAHVVAMLGHIDRVLGPQAPPFP